MEDDQGESFRVPEPSAQVRQKSAHHHAGFLFQGKEGALRGLENHGLGEGVGELSCPTRGSECDKSRNHYRGIAQCSL